LVDVREGQTVETEDKAAAVDVDTLEPVADLRVRFR